MEIGKTVALIKVHFKKKFHCKYQTAKRLHGITTLTRIQGKI